MGFFSFINPEKQELSTKIPYHVFHSKNTVLPNFSTKHNGKCYSWGLSIETEIFL